MLSESTCTSSASGSKLRDNSTTPSIAPLLKRILSSKIAKCFKMLLLIQDHLHDTQTVKCWNQYVYRKQSSSTRQPRERGEKMFYIYFPKIEGLEKMVSCSISPVFLPGKFHGQRSLAGSSPWGHKELDTTEHICTQIDIYGIKK